MRACAGTLRVFVVRGKERGVQRLSGAAASRGAHLSASPSPSCHASTQGQSQMAAAQRGLAGAAVGTQLRSSTGCGPQHVVVRSPLAPVQHHHQQPQARAALWSRQQQDGPAGGAMSRVAVCAKRKTGGGGGGKAAPSSGGGGGGAGTATKCAAWVCVRVGVRAGAESAATQHSAPPSGSSRVP